MKQSIRFSLPVVLLVFALLVFVERASAQPRIKDVASVLGARENQLLGYGIVVGLAGQGDSDSSKQTRQTIQNMMKRYGMTLEENAIKAKNSAVVMVTAKIPPFARVGSKLDVEVSSMADAKSLQGGVLIQAARVGGDGQIYAVAQGPLSVGGFLEGLNSGQGGATLQKNHPTVGRIPNGAMVEKEIATDLFQNGMLQVVLNERDFTSAARMANAINQQVAPVAFAKDSGTVNVFVPHEAQNDMRLMEFVALVENVVFRPDVAARIIVNEKTGTIVANSRIQIASVVVSHGNLTVGITEKVDVSQPNPFTGNIIGDARAGGGGAGGAGGAGGTAAQGVAGAAETPLMIGANYVFNNDEGTQIQLPAGTNPPPGYRLSMIPSTGHSGVSAPGAVGAAGGTGGSVVYPAGPQTVKTSSVTTDVVEEKSRLIILKDMPTIQEVASALNSLGVTPRDMMSILQTMKSAGALQADLVQQ